MIADLRANVLSVPDGPGLHLKSFLKMQDLSRGQVVVLDEDEFARVGHGQAVYVGDFHPGKGDFRVILKMCELRADVRHDARFPLLIDAQQVGMHAPLDHENACKKLKV